MKSTVDDNESNNKNHYSNNLTLPTFFHEVCGNGYT
jgi:hypothetical protein